MDTTKIQATLTKGFAATNALVIAHGVERITRAYHKYEEYLANTPRGERCNSTMMDICGGKGDFLEMRMCGLEAMKAREVKILEKNIASRDARIIKKLADKGIYEIPEFEALADTDNGFTGYFEVGQYTVNIRIIVAGGYNIQRAHNRILVDISG